MRREWDRMLLEMGPDAALGGSAEDGGGVMAKPWETETWRIERSNGVTNRITVEGGDEDGMPVVKTDSGVYVRHEADMDLVAAAPELYRALEALNRWIDGKETGDGLAEYAAASDALRKARGEGPGPDGTEALRKARGQS